MHAHRIQVFHTADDDAVVLCVPDDFVFDFFPAGYGFLKENLTDGALFYALQAEVLQLFFVVSDSAARSSQRIGRSDDHRITVLCDEMPAFFQSRSDDAGRNRFADLLHQFFEGFPIFRFIDTFLVDAQQSGTVFFKDPLLIQRHSQVQPRLTSESGENAFWSFLFYDLLHGLFRNRFQIHFIRNSLIGHDGGRIAVDQNGLYALLGNGFAGLGSGVVKLGGLSDDDGTGTDDEYLFQCKIPRHYNLPPSMR